MVFLVNDFAWRMCTSTVFPYLDRQVKRVLAHREDEIDAHNMGPIEVQYRLLEKYDPAENLIVSSVDDAFLRYTYAHAKARTSMPS